MQYEIVSGFEVIIIGSRIVYAVCMHVTGFTYHVGPFQEVLNDPLKDSQGEVFEDVQLT